VQCRQPALLESSLIAPDRTFRIAKRTGHVVLITPTLLDHLHHGIGLGQCIAHRVLGSRHPRNHDQAPVRLRSHHASLVDDAETLGVVEMRKQIGTAAVGHAGGRYRGAPKKRTGLSSHPPRD